MLEGLKVVEFATYVAAPSAAAVMGDWGADVIKVESGRGDPTRRTFADLPHLEGNPVFELENRGKRGIVLDIAKPEGREALLRILKDADVFLTNVRPAAAEACEARLRQPARGPPQADLRQRHRLRPGRRRRRPAGVRRRPPSGRAAASRARLTPKGHEPPLCRPAMGDAVCALSTISATLAAVIERRRTGRGRLVETSLIRTGVYSIGWDMAIQLKWGRLGLATHPQGGVQPDPELLQDRRRPLGRHLPPRRPRRLRPIC